MEFYASLSRSVRRSDCAVIGVHDDGTVAHATPTAAIAPGTVRELHRAGDFAGRLGETLLLPPGAQRRERVLLVGLGASGSWSRRNYRRALRDAAHALVRSGARDAALYLTAAAVPEVNAYYRARYGAELVAAALYRIPDLKTAKKQKPPALSRLALVVSDKGDLAAARRGAADGAAIAHGQRLAKDLANLPANVCTPRYLGEAALRLARGERRLRVRVLKEAQIRRLKMGSFLSVTRGSDEPPRLIVAEYKGASARQAPIVLIGKGITFDTGGISLKDPSGMDEMKFDMSGAATVLGTIAALAASECTAERHGDRAPPAKTCPADARPSRATS